MRLAMINPPYRHHDGAWITVPPQGYGGIQWFVSLLIDGLLARGHHVTLFGAPGSLPRPGLTVFPDVEPAAVRQGLAAGRFDVIHDHSNLQLFRPEWAAGVARVSTHQLTGRPADPTNAVYVSESQRRLAAADDAPVVRLPVNPDLVRYSPAKGDHLLFLGRVSAWKGAFEAAAFAAAAGRKLWLAGPAWEQDYLARILAAFGPTVDVVGEIGGAYRRDLLATARAVLVFSQPVPGPWGGVWAEPGSTVVAEAAASGTPVVATPNGCLTEIVPHVGEVLAVGDRFDVSPGEARAVLDRLPEPATVRAAALREWGLERITEQYEDCYRRVLEGQVWGRPDVPPAGGTA